MNNTMQTYSFQIETRFTRDYFCGVRFLGRKYSRFSTFVNSIRKNCDQYIFSLSGGVDFLML